VDLKFPLSLGVGANYRFSDAFSAAFDVEWKQWSEFKQKKRSTGVEESPVDDDAMAFRIGAEYLTFWERDRDSVLAYRGGFFYEPRPAADDPDLLPIYGFSLGLGWTVQERFSLDFAYQYRWGEQSIPEFDYDIREHFLISSLVTYF
jgi:long-subunit fatty acid transport protein